MRQAAALLLIAVVAVAAPVPKAKKRPDAEAFVGSWEIVRSELNGKDRGGSTWVWAFDADLKMMSHIKGTPAERGSNWAVKLDPEKSPKEIDLSHYKGIYEWDGDDIRIAYTLGGTRPTTFDPKPDVYTELLRRVPEKK